ncbi:MAG: hypothetical protein Q9191_005410 [Dirinaria sp. TL-2023a]
MQGAPVPHVSVAAELRKVWEHFINVVPTRIMVFGPDDATETRHRNENPDGKENEEKGPDEFNAPPQVNSIFENWHWLPMYFFFLFSWAQDGLVSLVAAYLPVSDLGRHLLSIGIALLLCPVQFAATLASSYTAFSQKKTVATATEKKPSKDPREDSPPGERMSKTAIAVLLLRATAALYSWLAPITLVWASSVELTKACALELSRHLSLTHYASGDNLHFKRSVPDLGTVNTKLAMVLALYVSIWVPLTLPATIVLRRVHASGWRETQQRAMRIETQTPPKPILPTYLAAWRGFARAPYRRLLSVYACATPLLLLVGAGGISLSLTALVYSDTSGYMGFWASLLLHLKMAAGKLF